MYKYWKYINNINIINDNIKKFNDSNNIKIMFTPENDEEINQFLNDIKTFGKILKKDDIVILSSIIIILFIKRFYKLKKNK